MTDNAKSFARADKFYGDAFWFLFSLAAFGGWALFKGLV
jgi:hypothetical protein